MNFTAGADIWQNCGASADFLKFALLPFEWITGGNFSLVFAGIMILFTYIKYHKVIYPMLIAFIMLPITFFVFPAAFQNAAFLLLGVVVGIVLIKILIRQAKNL